MRNRFVTWIKRSAMRCASRGKVVKWLFIALAFGAIVASPTALSRANALPSGVLRLIVPFPPGGAFDVVARLLQPHLQKSLGQTVIVENIAGASGSLGAAAVARAPADGLTILVTPSEFAVNAAIRKNLQYDAERDFAPIAILATNPLLFLVNPEVKARTLQEFVALAKADPGKLNYATPGASSHAHVLLEYFSLQAGIKMLHLPYRGGAPAVMATVANDAQLTLVSPLAATGQLQGGKLRAIASGGKVRDSMFPDVPTTIESGFPNFEAVQWVGMLTRAGTPPEALEQLNAEVNKAVRQPAFADAMKAQGVTPAGGTAEELRALIAREIRLWKDVATKVNIATE
jgi:tripartite-type tricarboxylate transporter receptor subunit TctC